MGKPLALAVVVILVACQDGPPLGPEVEGPDAHRGPAETAGRFIVTLTDGSRPEQVARDHEVAPDFVYTRVLNGFAGSIAESARLGLLRDQRVTRVERNGVVQTAAPSPAAATVASTTTQTEPTWGLDRVDQRDNSLDGRYVYEFSGAGVTAHIVDTGIRYSHEEFGGRAVPGFDVLRDDGEDCHGHGTHVAGTGAASPRPTTRTMVPSRT